jgi:hypothetical protein
MVMPRRSRVNVAAYLNEISQQPSSTTSSEATPAGSTRGMGLTRVGCLTNGSRNSSLGRSQRDRIIPESFRRDVVAMARRQGAPLRTIAEDPAVSEDWPHRRIDRSTSKMTIEVGLSVALRQLIRTTMRCDRGSQFHSKGLESWKESGLQD